MISIKDSDAAEMVHRDQLCLQEPAHMGH